MGDPLSIAASAAGLLSLGLQCTEYLYQYYTTYRDRDQHLARTADRLGGLVHSLQVIDEIVRVRKWRSDEHQILQNVELSIAHCEDVVNELQDQTFKLKKVATSDWKQKVIVVGRRAAYPFKQSTLIKLGEDIDDFQDNLSVALQALQLKDSQNTQNELEDVKQIIKSVQAEHIASSLRQWLNAPDATIDYNNACSKRHAQTGQWLTQSSTFADWLVQDNSFLWLHGFAGCGKSVLHSTAVQATFRHRRADLGETVAFFSFTYNDKSKQDVSAALRALLLQLASQVAGFDIELQRVQTELHNGTPQVENLLELLQDAVTRCRNAYILLDALDESPEDGDRENVLSLIAALRKRHLPGLHLLVTSRDVPDIRTDLQIHQNMANTKWVNLRNDSIDQDIRDYVSYQMDHERGLQRWTDAQRQQIRDYLSCYAGGIFRWVECQLYPLKKCARSAKHLRNCLQTLPKSLDETYERMLCNIGPESRDDAQRILALLCFAPRPLFVHEVIEAIAVDIDDLNCYDKERKLEDADDLSTICPGLIDISSGSNRTVQICHFSVQEYLVSGRITQGPSAGFAMQTSIQHARICKTCLLYLTNEDFPKQSFTQELVNQFPLAPYAAQYWSDHYRHASKDLIQPLTERIVMSLTDQGTVDAWFSLWHADIRSRDATLRPISPLCYAAFLGLQNIVSIMLDKGADIKLPEANYNITALAMASRYGHNEAVEVLLNAGAHINARIRGRGFLVLTDLDQGGMGISDTALMHASLQGHENVVQTLLERGADVNARGNRNYTALMRASESGHEKVVQLLLDGGADLNASADHRGNALVMASQRGHEKVVQLLLDRGANVNNVDYSGRTALKEAIWGSHEEVILVLIDRGADIGHLGGLDTALIWATNRGFDKVAELLTKHGAKPI